MFDLDRFVKAQDPVIETVLRELRAGHKQTHWMWFVFPQLRGLGRSPMAQHYGIDNLDEARAYLGHAILRSRHGLSRVRGTPVRACRSAKARPSAISSTLTPCAVTSMTASSV